MRQALHVLLILALFAALPQTSEASLATFSLRGDGECQDSWIESWSRNCSAVAAQGGLTQPSLPPFSFGMEFTIDTPVIPTHNDFGAADTVDIGTYFNQPGTELRVMIGDFIYDTDALGRSLYRRGGLGRGCQQPIDHKDVPGLAIGHFMGNPGDTMRGQRGLAMTMRNCRVLAAGHPPDTSGDLRRVPEPPSLALVVADRSLDTSGDFRRVPEPPSLALVVAALGGLGLSGLHRRRLN